MISAGSIILVWLLCSAARIKPVVNEVEAHPLMAQRKLVGVCRRYGVTPAAHTPLGMSDDALLKHPKLVAAAAAAGSRSVEELLVRWSVQRAGALMKNAHHGIRHIVALVYCIEECRPSNTWQALSGQGG